MQQFPCPFCGVRDEREFHFVAEAGKTRPETVDEVSPRQWAAYLYSQRNDKGPVREVWMHLTCQELFVMYRDSVSMKVNGVTALRGSQT